MRKFSLKALVVAVGLVTSLGANALTTTGSFSCITSNGPGQCTQAESALGWSFSDITNLFTISAISTFTGNVTEVYFDTIGTALNITFASGIGSSFTAGAAPPNLPGGNPGFVSDFGFDSGSTTANGITGGDSASFLFAGGGLDSLQSGGVHVRSLIAGTSESLVTVSAVPEPETYAMMLAGLGLMGVVARRRKAKQG